MIILVNHLMDWVYIIPTSVMRSKDMVLGIIMTYIVHPQSHSRQQARQTNTHLYLSIGNSLMATLRSPAGM